VKDSTKKAIDTLNKLSKETKTTVKEQILKDEDCKELRTLLDINLNDSRIFHIAKLPDKQHEGYEPVTISKKGVEGLEILCKKMESNEISGFVAVNSVLAFLSNCTSEESKWFKKCILKESIGIGHKITNKVFKTNLSSFSLMLAPNSQPDLDKISYPKIIQPKIDGFRCVYIPGQGLVGRNGKKIRNKNLELHFKTLFGITDYVFDGELYCHGIGFNKVASVLNSDDKEVPEDLKYYIFDGMWWPEWKTQKCTSEYERRLEETREQAPEENIEVLETEIVYDSDEVSQKFEEYIELGYEGAMLKDAFAKYEWKRVTLNSEVLMKIKSSFTEDCKTTGFVEGEGKYVGMLGKIIVDFKGVSVGVGSGFSDKERKEIWKNRKKYLNVYAEIKGMEVTVDKSIRHPIWVRWRLDK
jgi:DNA ligase-1